MALRVKENVRSSRCHVSVQKDRSLHHLPRGSALSAKRSSHMCISYFMFYMKNALLGSPWISYSHEVLSREQDWMCMCCVP